MKGVRLADYHRLPLETAFESAGMRSFYHYFPLMMALSESTIELRVESTPTGHRVWVSDTELYCRPVYAKIPKSVKKIWVSTVRPPMTWKPELYDVNFIYDLKETLQIKNFRKNVQRFLKEHPDAYYTEAGPIGATEVVEAWYKRNKQQEYYDFGYTMWLAGFFGLFEDLRARLVKVAGAPVAFSLWGQIDNQTAIHLICKDLGWPYLQDYARYMTYEEMLEQGFTEVNDGGDAGLHGLRVYKLKLRPKLIIPIYSWVKR